METYPTVHARRRAFEFLLGPHWREGKAWSVFAGRIALGFFFLWSGYQKVLTELGGKMATSGFLSGSSVAGSPFAGFFNSLAGSWAVEYLVVFGEIAIGIALTLGLFTRIGAVSGAAMMLLFTVATWPIADTPGANPIVDSRVLYGLTFVMFYFLTPGRFLGVDGVLERTGLVRRHPRLLFLLG